MLKVVCVMRNALSQSHKMQCTVLDHSPSCSFCCRRIWVGWLSFLSWIHAGTVPCLRHKYNLILPHTSTPTYQLQAAGRVGGGISRMQMLWLTHNKFAFVIANFSLGDGAALLWRIAAPTAAGGGLHVAMASFVRWTRGTSLSKKVHG